MLAVASPRFSLRALLLRSLDCVVLRCPAIQVRVLIDDVSGQALDRLSRAVRQLVLFARTLKRCFDGAAALASVP